LERLRPLSLIGAIAWAVLGLAPATALAAFGFEEVDVAYVGSDGSPARQAGSHPFALTTTLRLNTVEDSGFESPDGDLRHLRIDYPAGFIAMPTAVPACSNADFIDIEGEENACADSSAIGVGGVTASASGPIAAGSADFLDPVPVYKLTPAAGSVARIGFVAAGQPVVAQLGLGVTPPHSGFVQISDLTQAALFYSARIAIWGVPANPVHDPDRGQCAFSAGSCPVAIPQKPFLTASRSCSGPVVTDFGAISWQDPPQSFMATATSPSLIGCGALAFSPQVDAQPTTDLADTPSGLNLSIDFFDDGLADPGGIAQSEAKKIALTLPEGMDVPSGLAGAPGQATCTPAQFAQETLQPAPGAGCPLGSEVGTLEVETPLLEGEILEGRVFAAQPDSPATTAPGAENPFDSPLALYVVVRDPQLGILVKQAGAGEVDPLTGQLIATFDQLPQLPFSHLGLQLNEGADGPLLTPPECDDFVIEAAVTPWSAPGSQFLIPSSFEIVAGPGGGPCPSGEEPVFDPGTDALSQTAPAALPAVALTPWGPGPPNPAKRRRCPKGKHRVRGKVRCVRKRCLPRRAGKRVVRRCLRPQGRRQR